MSNNIFVKSSADLSNVSSQLRTLNGKFKESADGIRREHRELTTKWEGEASDAFRDNFKKEEPALTNFYQAIEEYAKALDQIRQKYETYEKKNVSIARK